MTTFSWFLWERYFSRQSAFQLVQIAPSSITDIFLYSYEAEFIQSGKELVRIAVYINDVLSINNTDFENYLGQMYPVKLDIKDTTTSNTSTSYLDLLLSIKRDGQLHTPIFLIVLFLSSDIPSSPPFGVFISQTIRYDRGCSCYECHILIAKRLSNKLLKQEYILKRLKSSDDNLEVLQSIRGYYKN